MLVVELRKHQQDNTMSKLLKTKCSKCLSVKQKLYLKGSRCYSQKCPFEKNKIHLPGRHIAFNRPIKNNTFMKFIISKRIVKAKYRITIAYLKGLLQLYSVSNYLNKLESRLDNSLCKIGLFPTISSARQFITHKSLILNNKIINLPGILLNKGDVISFKDNNIPTNSFIVSKTNIESNDKNVENNKVIQKSLSSNWFNIENNIITIIDDIKADNVMFDANNLTSGLLRS